MCLYWYLAEYVCICFDIQHCSCPPYNDWFQPSSWFCARLIHLLPLVTATSHPTTMALTSQTFVTESIYCWLQGQDVHRVIAYFPKLEGSGTISALTAGCFFTQFESDVAQWSILTVIGTNQYRDLVSKSGCIPRRIWFSTAKFQLSSTRASQLTCLQIWWNRIICFALMEITSLFYFMAKKLETRLCFQYRSFHHFPRSSLHFEAHSTLAMWLLPVHFNYHH